MPANTAKRVSTTREISRLLLFMNRRTTLSSGPEYCGHAQVHTQYDGINMHHLGIPAASDWTCIGMFGTAPCLQKFSKPSDHSSGKLGGTYVYWSWIYLSQPHCHADLAFRPSTGLVSQCH